MYLLSDYDYNLPENLIAQLPVKKRDNSKLLCLNKKDGSILNKNFFELESFLEKGDLLIINDTEVIPARLYAKKETGGKVELLVLNFHEDAPFENDKFLSRCLIKSSKRLKENSYIFFGDKKGKIAGFDKNICLVEFDSKEELRKLIFSKGKVPLPPYIKRDADNEKSFSDKQSYQTIYASQKGAIAAPTAGLHFTKEFFDKIKAKGIDIAKITLHVGYGTFVPVRASDIREHNMHSESFVISKETAEKINEAKKKKSRIIAVGTTSVRTLEFAADKDGYVKPMKSDCDLFIYPGYEFKVVDAMITNFHLPKSTLLMLVSAFAGIDAIFSAYKEAVTLNYRFFSYGDAMFIG